MAHRAVDATYRSTTMLRLLFGIMVPRHHVPMTRFDVTTYALSRHVRRRLTGCSEVLDMGTGPAATLGLFLWKRTGCSVTCADVDAGFVQSAREVIALNGARLAVTQSCLLEGVSTLVDTVVFNPPYVPTSSGQRRNLPTESRSQWDGGPDGTEVIRSFLSAVARWSGALRVYLGVNRRHVDTGRVIELVESTPSLHLEGVARSLVLPVSILTFRKHGGTVSA